MKDDRKLSRYQFLQLSVLGAGGVVLAACGQTQAGATPVEETNKGVVRRLFEELLNRGDLAVVDELYAKEFVDHSAGSGQTPGPAGIKQAVADFRGMFPDLKATVDDLIAEGDKVVSRETWRGTHKASGKAAVGEVIHIFRLEDGRVVEEWSKGWEWLDEYVS